LEFDQAPFGIVGLETANWFSVELVHQGVISLERLVELCSTNPARIFGLKDRGTLHQGAPGLTLPCLILSSNGPLTCLLRNQKSRNTPFHGRSMTGAAVATIVGGRIVYLHPDYSRITRQNKTPRPRSAELKRSAELNTKSIGAPALDGPLISEGLLSVPATTGADQRFQFVIAGEPHGDDLSRR